MKVSTLKQWLTGTIIALGVSINHIPLSSAQTSMYFCDSDQGGVPTTFVSTSRGNIPMIRWVSETANSSNLERCQQVSARFQRASDNSTLQYIKSGIVNNQTVICGTSQANDSCSATNTLFSLTNNQNPVSIIQSLTGIGYSGADPVEL